MDYNIPKLPERPKDSNKGTFGKILNVSGSEYMTGAAYLSSISALKIGAGYVELASHENVLRAISTLSPEIVLAPITKIPEIIKTSTVLLIGCGLSTSDEAVNLFKLTTAAAKKLPTIIDADGLNILAENKIELPENTVLTPHPKEAARLLHTTLDKILQKPEDASQLICQTYKCVTILKSHRTIVASQYGTIYHNKTGNSALAKAGSGDVLAGMIAGLLAQHMNIFEASVLGVYLHGLAGDLAENDLTAYGVLASDTIRYIPNALKKYLMQYS